MQKNLRWKLLIILGVIALAVWSFTPPSRRIHLGLDLRGGVQFVLKVETDDALRVETETAAQELQDALKAASIAVTGVHTTSLTTFDVQGVPQESDQQFRTIADQQLSGSYDRQASGSGTYTFTMKPNVVVSARDEAVTQAIQTIDRRINELGVSEPNIAPYGSAGDEIIVQLPGVTDIDRAKELISSTAFLELRLVQGGPAANKETLLQPYNGKLPEDMEILPGASPTSGDTSTFYYLVNKVPAITGRDLRNARQTVDQYNTPAVSFTLNSAGVTKFTRVTGANVGRQLAIVLDGRVQSAPVIESQISQPDAQITGHFTQQEANDLALILRSGALPARLAYEEQQQVGPTLGQDSIRAGVTSSLVGLGLVTIFMLVYYRLAGINAFVSISLNLVILLGFMSYLDAVMTLPGIAGFILTIGMGVDSNVLIFERVREELEAKKGVRQALAAGFDRVFITIIDTHVSSLIAAGFLFQFGTGPIRGFATTLFFGLISNIFTAVFVSRTLFEFMLSRRPAGATRLSI
jgi:preprotein translocase subunit SecD